MRSYILAIGVSMFLAAVYVFQNTGEIVVRFLIFEGTYQQGVWEVLLFAVGVVLMWFFSLFASMELRSKHNKRVRELEGKVKALTEERDSLLGAFKHMTPTTVPVFPSEEPAGAQASAPASSSEASEKPGSTFV